MTQRTWNGSTGLFSDPSAWSPFGAPADGDTATIDRGTLTETGPLPNAFILQVVGNANSPTANLANTAIMAGSHLQVTATQANSTVSFTGSASNAGSIDLSGTNPGSAILQVVDVGASASTLTNTGGINIVGTNAILQTSGGNPGTQLINNGVISVRDPGAPGFTTADQVGIGGTGSIRLGLNAAFEVSNAVGSGQTIVFEPGATTAGQLNIDFASLFSGTVSGFGSHDNITTISQRYDAYDYVSTGASSGNLVFTSAGATVSSIAFSGAYTRASFTLGTQVGSTLERTTITTSVPDAPATIAYTDTVTNVSAVDTAAPYSDPNVPYLQHAYSWNSPDSVAISATTSNVFLHGGSGGDALAVTGGSNVLDGGGGSNFLVGATGADGGTDTFFVDGRNQVNTWSSILNFHQGDLATIFGFHPGVSTMPFTAVDGAAGATGLTIHSELNGAGSGVNGSITFAGITQAVSDAHFTYTTGTLSAGTPGAIDYLLVQYNR